MSRRVHRPGEKEGLFKALTEGEQVCFLTFKDVMMTAACLAFQMKTKKPVDKRGKEIPWSIFNGHQPIINAIALLETSDVNILLDHDEAFKQKVEIFESYANAGLDILKKKVLDTPGNSFDNLMGLIHEFNDRDLSDEDQELNQLVGDLNLD